ncbi:hypothetical protein KFK09_025844 [Dendrobium nobile]|uniref:Non-haem dioxygenase N-terminal domain-containing protein n=1 Tax=Dendrobium nobile TaxID=94219 RepID=A0A8T3A6I8_DENNO|nr:hypothetical protein KFK09_025844 [Dendrobium nobile]
MAASPRTSRDLTLFRAPPPSPAAITRNTSPETHEDDDFSRFLKRSRRIPELILPHRNPPEIDLGSLISPERELSEKDNLRSAARSMGCFQIINHGIKQRVIQAAVEAAKVVFEVPLERKKEAARSPERKWGFEVEEEDDVAESDEFFWWSGDAVEMAGVLAPEYDAFSGKMEQLLKKMRKIATKIELSLMDSRKEVNDMIICVRKHRRSREANFSEEGVAFDLNHDVLGAFIRSLGSSHALSFHLFIGASRFRVYSKQAPVSFRPTDGAIVVTVGDQMQEKSGGIYRQVIGKPEYQYREAQQEPISITFLHSSAAVPQASASSSKAGAGKEEENIISISKQLIIAACLLLFYHIIAYFCFSKA